jgi:myo-inositol-1(or 4)-monophosphatase
VSRASTPDALRPDALLASALAAARRAAEVIERHATAEARARLEWREKGATDFVTMVDTAAERAIAECLLGEHPDATLVGEELSPGALDAALASPLAFVADPLDGTTNFLHGFPWYAVSVAALVWGEIVAGAVLNAATGETFTATAGGGACRDGRPIRVSAIDEPSRALVGTGFPFK